jgi:diaminohydroxyphosphoribosylaminopyrimidine deaminase/5-amino-6-(5-phosphoribosylamino)uracil reductase
VTPADDARFLALALSLGARALGQVWPNPAVGCVIVDSAGRIAGRGVTAPGGRPHAESIALVEAGPRARGATAYVSLEPCAHHGRTPPCADALIAAGVARVVTAIDDPDPRTAGQGHARLAAAGVEVAAGRAVEAAARLHRGFFTRVRHGRPMVTLKLATSLDGRIATATGESRWISGPEARARVQLLRATHDAVMVGAGTARADLPALLPRGMRAPTRPVRIVVAASLDLPRCGPLWEATADAPLWLLHTAAAPQESRAAWAGQGAEAIESAEAPGGGVAPDAALALLGARGLTRVLCEGGGRLGAALLAADCVDEVVLFTGGSMLGADARPALGALGLAHLAQAPRFALVSSETVGPDVMTRWERR